MLKKLPNAKSIAHSIKTRAKSRVAKTEDANYVVGLDIGTENVKALIGKLQANGSIDVIGVGRAHQKLTDMQAGAVADITGVVANCDRALAAAEEQAGVSVRTAVIGIAGELVKGTTTTVKISRKDAEKTLDIPELEQIIGLVQERAQAKAKQQLMWELGGKDVEIRLVNSALVHIDIDGYAVTNPIGFQGKEVVVQLYTAFAPMIHIGALERVALELDLDLLAVAAEPFAVSRAVIGDDASNNMDAILMDVGGGTTDIAVIHEGGVQGTKMFGIGGRAFTRSIERELSVSFAHAENLKLTLSDQPGGKKKESVEKAIKDTLHVWLDGVSLALGEFSVDRLPHQLFLCGGGSSLEALLDSLETTEWYKELPMSRKPTVQYIDPAKVRGVRDTTGALDDHTVVTAMGLLRVGADTLLQEQGKPAGSVRETIDRILRI